MSVDIFEAKNYKQFLLQRMPTIGGERGARTKLAEYLGCQLSYVSLVLTTDKHHFNLEHGQRISQFLNLSDLEMDFFILMLSRDRAGSKELELFYNKKIQMILKERSDVKNRITNHSSLDNRDQAIYYSDWYYTAIHMILRCHKTIGALELSKMLGLSVDKVHEALEFLERVGILTKEKGKFVIQDVRIHVPEGATWLNAHHKNWRNRSILSLDDKKDEDLHYTMITSISESAAKEIRKKILKMIQENEPIIRDADDKVVYAFNLDFFKLS
jgi:uncharacterized protein (TIGR02147 family)